MAGLMPHFTDVVAINRAASTPGNEDNYNQPDQVFSVIATKPALIQPKAGREVAQMNENGVVRGRYDVYMLPTDVTEGDHLVTADGEVYELTFVADAAGARHHLEIDAERVYP